jgi:hypothetical protein
MTGRNSADSNLESERKFRIGDTVRILGSPNAERGQVIHFLSRNRYGVELKVLIDGNPQTSAVVYGEDELQSTPEA